MRAAAMLIPALMLSLAVGAHAQPGASAPAVAGPKLDSAVKLARAAIAACRAKRDHVAALVVDAAGQPVVLLSDDGAVALAQVLAPRKTALVIRYKTASSVIAERAKSDAALAAEIKADPKIGFALPGALPLIEGGAQIGAIAVSGGSSPAGDEACAQAALARVIVRKR